MGSLYVPEPASAAKMLFRMERRFYGAPFPAFKIPHTPKGVTQYGGAGRYESYVVPYTWHNPYGGLDTPEATVVTGNPVGAPFTLPKTFHSYFGTTTLFSSTAFTGYTTISQISSYNGLGQFRPYNRPPLPTTPTTNPPTVDRVVFPTTGGNPVPNLGAGSPAFECTATPMNHTCGTQTFSGRYDLNRAGTLNVKPGGKQFGGTMRILYGPNSTWYQYIRYNSPVFYKAYGSFLCRYGSGKGMKACTGGSLTTTTVGQLDTTGMATRFVLTNPTHTNKATTGMFGNYVTGKAYYLHVIHPWTTGGASAYNYRSWSAPPIRPYVKGYDKSLMAPKITLTHTFTAAFYKGKDYTKAAKVYFYYYTHKQYLTDVRRVVSLVRPRLTHSLNRPVPPDPIDVVFQAARLWAMKIFFLPEPHGMLLLGAGIATLAGLARFRRR
jgi:hypothetical protein